MRSLVRGARGAVGSSLTAMVGATAGGATSVLSSSIDLLTMSRRHQNWGGTDDYGSLDGDIDSIFGKATTDSQSSAYTTNPSDPGHDGWSTKGPLGTRLPEQEMSSVVRFEKLNKVPSKFDILSFSNCYVWRTNAAVARKIVGPLREWSTEVKYRTGVHLETDPTYPNKLGEKLYTSADEVEMSIYAFGSDRSVIHTAKLMESMLQQNPAYVRLGIFRRVPDSAEVEWLTLRRINSEFRPPDIPPISLKLTGKHTLLFENFKEAAIRSAWEECGVALDPKLVYPTGMLSSDDPDYFWRVPVRYFVAELPAGAETRGPLPSDVNYLQAWDSRILRQSPDPIDQVWGKQADPSTGTAWLKTSQLNELQKPLRGDHYMSIRYTPPPFSDLQSVLNLPPIPVAGN